MTALPVTITVLPVRMTVLPMTADYLIAMMTHSYIQLISPWFYISNQNLWRSHQVVDSVYEATHAETGEQVPEYQIIKSSSQRQDKLIDREGYAFSVTCKRGPTTYWHCFVQNKTINCKATIIQLFEEEWPNEAGATGIC